MKSRYLFKFIAFLIALLLMNTNVQTIYAADNSEILVNAGYPEDIVDILSNEDKMEGINAIKNNKLDVQSTILEVDVLSEIETYVNSTYNEKIRMGLSDKQINATDFQINSYRKMSDKELKKVLDLDNVQLKLFKKAIEPSTDFEMKNAEHDVRASGSITSSEMTFTQSVTDNSTTSKSSYTVSLYFYWKDVYFYGMFNDKVITAWGGNLTQSIVSRSIGYYSVNDNNDWNKYSTAKTPTYEESSINGGGYYSFAQALYDTSSSKARYGNIKYKLSQNGKEGKTTKILAQYAHQILTVGSSSISVSVSGPSVSISVGTAYDKSNQLSKTITY